MTREQQIVDLLRDHQPLLDILTGGIYTDEEIGVEGVRRGPNSPTELAFNEIGALKPLLVVRQRGVVPYGNNRDQAQKIVMVGQSVDCFYYQNRGYDQIEPARDMVFSLLEGTRLTNPGSYPLIWQADSAWFPDTGPVANSSTMQQEWLIVFKKSA